MKDRKSPLRRWLPLVAAFVVGAASVGVSFAANQVIKGNLKVTKVVTARNFKYNKPKTNRLVIPGAAFVGDTETDDVDHGDYSGEIASDTGAVAVAPVNLPQGAVVTKVVWYYGASNAADANLHLEANNRTGDHDDMVDIANVACATEPCSVMTTTISPNTINNKQRHYGLWLDMGPGHWTYSVVIFYKTSLPGPATGLPAGAVWDTAGVASHS